MTLRRRLAVLAASSIVLAGCAVPGQPAAPGVALTYEGSTVTTAELEQLAAEWTEASAGTVVPDRRELATFATLGPDALAKVEADSEEAGEAFILSPGNVRTIGEQWFLAAGATEPELSDELVESMAGMLAIFVVAAQDQTLEDITALSERVEAEGEFSPRLGEYSTDALLASIDAAFVNAQSLPGAAYVAFVDVNGFQGATDPAAARD